MKPEIRKSFLIACYFMITLGVVAQNTVQDSQTFTFQGNTFQNYTIPVSGWYKLEAKGGQGGPAGIFFGGKGASMSCYYYISAGEQLRIAVARAGQKGDNSNNNIPNGGGGGGSSSIVKMNGNTLTPILIAGGGGGASSEMDGSQGVIQSNGTNGNCSIANCTSAGGVNGSGGNITSDENGGAGGAGYIGDGGSKITTSGGWGVLQSYGGQCYLSGNYGGSVTKGIGGDGGWGGGGEGGSGNTKAFGNICGSGGGGGGYSGGGGGSNCSGGGGGGSYINPSAKTNGLVQLAGSNTGDGTVVVSLLNTATESIISRGSYKWPVNGVLYLYSGTYAYVDSANAVIRILDLSIMPNFVTSPAPCPTFNRVDTTVVSCGGFTWARNGRTYTENLIDSIRIGCTRYIINLIVNKPQLNTGAMAPKIAGPQDHKGNLIACANTSVTYSVPAIPFTSSYKWILPEGARGTSSTNTITVYFSKKFKGGTLAVAPVNACGAGNRIIAYLKKAEKPASKKISIAGPNKPIISGRYTITPVDGATIYTWKLSNDSAVIVSGQGTTAIQIETLPGFKNAILTVVPSNCAGIGEKIKLHITTVIDSTIGDDDDIKDDEEKNEVNADNAFAGKFIDFDQSLSVSAYPNPTMHAFNLMTKSLDNKKVSIRVMDMQGRVIKTLTAKPNHSAAFGSDLKPGIYMVEVKQGTTVKTVRIVKY